ncbi:Hypothetical protein NTJ_05781 [Nesidiocoris tenuis]|uniref:Uncharacterized protein n=1 Tax=Nesidiocoris tenuis TaxID=355587 RepID=A0ABN7ANV2_9HEMI|nr:Hypothetical protein NTJ_05781 [Nesidiocoris tenuis]
MSLHQGNESRSVTDNRAKLCEGQPATAIRRRRLPSAVRNRAAENRHKGRPRSRNGRRSSPITVIRNVPRAVGDRARKRGFVSTVPIADPTVAFRAPSGPYGSADRRVCALHDFPFLVIKITSSSKMSIP